MVVNDEKTNISKKKKNFNLAVKANTQYVTILSTSFHSKSYCN